MKNTPQKNPSAVAAPAVNGAAPRVLRIAEACELTRLSKAKVYALMDPAGKYYDETFPRPIRLGTRSVYWLESELYAWIETKRSQRDADLLATA